MNRLYIDVLTLFPEMFTGVLGSSIMHKAQEKELAQFTLINYREYAPNKHGQVDDYPYGGGAGMVLKPEPLFLAVEDRLKQTEKKPRIILMCPQGEVLTQQKAEELATEEYLMFICGHYEGYDERIRKHLVTDELSIGDYVLTGGELPAMVVMDSVVRLREGVLGNALSPRLDSFSTGLLEHPHYTRPAQFRDMSVPDILLSGHHEQIATWRRKQSLYRTWLRRPDLLLNYPLNEEEKNWLEAWKKGKID